MTLQSLVFAAPKVEDKSQPNTDAVRMAIEDLSDRFPEQYPDDAKYLSELKEIEVMSDGNEKTAALKALRREALLANPLLDFDSIILVRRKKGELQSHLVAYKRTAGDLGLPLNFNGNSDLPRSGYENQIVLMKKIHYEGFKPSDSPQAISQAQGFVRNTKRRARLLSKVYEIDPMVCPGCMGEQ